MGVVFRARVKCYTGGNRCYSIIIDEEIYTLYSNNDGTKYIHRVGDKNRPSELHWLNIFEGRAVTSSSEIRKFLTDIELIEGKKYLANILSVCE